MTRAKPPLIEVLPCEPIIRRSVPPVTDPHSLVIGFGLLAFALVLAHRVIDRRFSDIDMIGPAVVMLLAASDSPALGTAIALHLLPQRRRLLRVIAFVGALLILGVAAAILARVRSEGIQVLQIGSWPAPYGITLVADLFSALMVVMVGILGVAVTGSSFSGVDPRREAFGYHALIHVLLMGVSGAF